MQPYCKNTALQVLTDLEAPVETLDFDSKSNHLAIGIGSEVQVAKKISEGWPFSWISPRRH